MTPLTTFLSRLASGVRRVLFQLIGKWQWDAPPWLQWLGRSGRAAVRYLTASPVRAAIVALAVVLVGFGAYSYSRRPKPNYIGYAVTAPPLTVYDDKGMRIIRPMTVVFADSVAPLTQVQTAVVKGITLSPELAGTWFWASDRELRFTPKDDWPVDEQFSVTLARQGVLTQKTVLEEYDFEFRSQPFSAQITESRFYQDPRDPRLKKVVATVGFSHPVDEKQFESRISLLLAKDAEYLGLTSDSRHFTVSYDKLRLEAYVHSAALPMPRDDTPMTMRVERGIRAARGGNETADRLEAVVTIPGRASLRFSNANMTVVDNARYEPEQILLLKSSSPVAERAFDGNVSVRLLPLRSPRQAGNDRNPYDWSNESQIGEDILSASDPVRLTYVPSDEGGETSHGFRFRAPVGRFLHVVVKDGVQGTGGYISGKPYVASVRVQPYPQALSFLGQGSLLSLAGDRRLGFLVRDVQHVRVEIARVLPNQLQHIAPNMGDFERPALYDNLEDKVAERFITTRDYDTSTPGKPKADSIDVGEYLQERGESQQRGLFLLHIRAVAGPIRAPGEDEGADPRSEYDEGNYDEGGLEDTRLILVTDLGFIVKFAKDGSRDVYVQSIHTGLPVAGARVELAGRNGQTVLTATTDGAGHAHLPRVMQPQRERQPQLIIVRKDADYSFMPLRVGGRDLNLSRFDTGGVESAASAQQLSSYLFSDRGIYRPGETAHLGIITRTADWQSPLTGLPIDIEITDARGTVVGRQRLRLSSASFEEVTHTLPPGAPTGTYEAVAYLPKDERRRDVIGNTAFRVQEFEPDRMKVQLDLSASPVAGWLKPEDVNARATVAHLFGAAASGRRVEGELSLTPALPRFTRHTDYRFQIGEVLKEPYREQLAAAVTDDKGVAVLTLDLERFAGRAYRLNLLARAFEAEGGRNVAAQNSVIVSEAPFLVGVKPDGDLAFVRRGSARSARWLAVDQRLDPVASGDVTLEWVQRRFVSVLTQQGGGTLKYVSKMKELVRNVQRVSIAQGGTTLPLPTEEPGDFVMVMRDSAGGVLNTLAYSVAGQANLSRSLERDSELQIQLNKDAYSAGDVIEVSIRAPYVGAGLITIERERVYQHVWFKTTTTSSVQRISVPDGFEGNGYVSVQFVRDAASDELFMSPLSYGVAAFNANLAARTQTVTLRAPREVKPGSTLTMRVTPSEASRVAVLAVDEGILQVARYRSPDPLGFFFQKRMLEVQTSQILDLILPDFKRFLALAAPGGDADGGFARHLNPFNRKRKAPVAYWSGIVDVGPEGRELRYTVPDYFNGRLRIVTVAASARRVGVAEAGTEVRGDFILTPNVPAMAAPGDEFIVSVGVYNSTRGQSGPIRVELQGSAGASIVGPAGVDLQIADSSEGTATFRVKANQTLGSASLVFGARRGASDARMEESVSIRPAVGLRTQLTLGRVDGATAEAALTREMFSERRVVDAAVSTVPLVWGRGLSAYLDNYEYTCTEQLVSKGVSGLVLLTRPEFGRIRERTQRPLDPTYSVIRARLNGEGGLGLWASTPQTAEFPTVYAAHFLVDAKERGEAIPQDVLDRMNAWLMRYASTPAGTLADARLHAYAVYVLARQGIKPTAALANVEQELTRRYPKEWTTDLAAAYVAATYRLMQRNDDATRMARGVPWSTQPGTDGDSVYYDALVHDAQLVYLLSKHFPTLAGAIPPAVLETVARGVSGNRASSLAVAYTILGLDAYAKSSTTSGTLGISEIARDGRERPLTLPAGAIPTVPISEAAARVRFSRQGSPTAFYVLAESGFDRRPPAAAVSQGLEIIREFVDGNGNPLTKVAVGQEFLVRLRVRSTERERVSQIAIVDLLPGGVEPVLELQAPSDSSTPGNDPALTRGTGTARALPVGLPDKSDWTPSHVDVREDRFILYGDVTKTAGTFVYRVRANNAGTFQVPPAFAEGMYNRTISGVSRGGTLEVTPP